MSNENDQLLQLCERARAAKYAVQQLSTDKKNAALKLVADKLVAATDSIIEANKIDYKASEDKGVSPALLDRLMLNKERIEAMAEGVRQVADLPDPVGEVLEEFERPNGLKFKKVRVPLGVIGIIYESRPNVTADAFALTFKSGNAVILKGGSDAINSNIAIVEAIQEGLKESGITESAIELMKSTDRETTTRFMQMKDYVDVLIPRGSKGLIMAVSENSKIPVLYAAAGNCHIYIDKDADVDKAVKIAVNAKTQRLGVCNAAESLVVHEDVLDTVLPKVAAALREKNVVLYSDPASLKAFSDAEPATEEDFATEYLDLKMSVKTVKNVDEAIEHINRYSTHHSEAIITENSETADRFLDGVDSACVYWNASTRWTDGFEFGFGAEIGICTQKLHARGPMGLKELTSYKYRITGNGQIRG
ncbi:MAG: glutamate-5-semialdehyde dehydrogenase [Lachnospiraceae bacterium]|nr:glutamate-5-semialdehyde dehydrogenase [Lachnospiraceae bacterium]